ncbi:type IV toxin-antitoxin system AbiEi family antitoxin domain-containing protein [Bradyrhizobium sp. RDT10]
MLDAPVTLSAYTTRLQAAGKISFTRDEAMRVLGLSKAAFLKSAKRLEQKQQLVSPRNGFYVIVPPQYLSWGAPPPTWYIDQLMRHENRPYYVGLLKAAELQGASHHAVMEFQIITNKQIPKMRVGRSMLVSQGFFAGLERITGFQNRRWHDETFVARPYRVGSPAVSARSW